MINFSLSYSLSYSGQWLNRARQIRQNPQWVKEVQDKQDSLFIPLWHNQCFLALPADAPIILSQERFQQLSLGSEPFFLGLDRGRFLRLTFPPSPKRLRCNCCRLPWSWKYALCLENSRPRMAMCWLTPAACYIGIAASNSAGCAAKKPSAKMAAIFALVSIKIVARCFFRKLPRR